MPNFAVEGRAWARDALDSETLDALDAFGNTGDAPGRRLQLKPPQL
jgi:hypothetical protein